MKNRKALLPLCSGVLGVLSLALQVTAVATPYWADFFSDDPYGNAHFPVGINNYFEKGHYGLWTVCVTIFHGRRMYPSACNHIGTIFDPGKLRYIAGALAIIDVIALLIFLFPIPAQLAFLMYDKGIVNVRYTTLTIIKLITLIVGIGCGVAAAVLIGIKTVPFYEVPKGWSFGLQVVVIILQVFLLICTATEHVIGKRYPNVPLSRMASRQSVTDPGLHNPGFTMTSPVTPSTENKLSTDHHIFPISATPESGRPYVNGPRNTYPSEYNYKKTLPVDDNIPGNRKSMQYLEDTVMDSQEQLQQQPPPKKPPPREKFKSQHKLQKHYKNNAYKSSKDSDLDTSNPSITSRGSKNGSNLRYSSASRETVTSASKSTDV